VIIGRRDDGDGSAPGDVNAGKMVILFDNSYSWYTAKELKYDILIEPLSVTDEDAEAQEETLEYSSVSKDIVIDAQSERHDGGEREQCMEEPATASSGGFYECEAPPSLCIEPDPIFQILEESVHLLARVRAGR